METIILKFGGSSLADNIKLNIVANKITEFYHQKKKVVVVVSAQGKTTDNLIKEAKELSYLPDEREMDVLMSTGEQISAAKLSILLKRMGYPAISLTGWQAGICTSKKNGEAKIEQINTSRIHAELDKNNIVIITGFQGINELDDITTLGRGGSDTTAVAVASAIKADHCYIFSDVDGIYSADPKQINNAQKLEKLSYDEMLDLSDEGAKVLHNRCVEIAQKYKTLIETGSTFNDNTGTVICDKIEESKVKSIVKNDNLLLISLKYETYSDTMFYRLCELLIKHGVSLNTLINNSISSLNICFTIKSSLLNKFQELLENEFKIYQSSITNISRISLIGYGIANHQEIISKLLDILNSNKIGALLVQTDECKISVIAKEKVSDKVVEELHHSFID